MNVNELRQAMAQALKTARDTAQKAVDENRELSADERSAVTTALDTAKGYKTQLEQRAGDADLLKSLGDLETGIGVAEPAPTGPATPAGRGKSAGEKFIGSTAWKSFLDRYPGGRIPESAKGIASGAVELGGLKALITGASETSAGALVVPEQYGFVDVPTRPLTIKDLITVGTTDSDAVDYVRQGARTNNAAPVAEATSAARIGAGAGEVTAAAGGLKPESGFVLEKDTAAVKTIAHWIPATKRSLSDASQIVTLIDNFLRTGLEEELEDQIVAGNGAGENFRGILETPGTTVQPFAGDLLTTTRQAKTKVRVVGRAIPTAYVFNPEDNEKIDLLRESGATGAFLFGGPATTGTQTLWGVPRIESEAIPVGTGVVADWRQAVCWDRQQATVQVSDSHADFFVRNLVAFLAELRAAFAILRPPAFVEIDLSA